MHEASYYSIDKTGNIRCDLCPHYCIISSGKYGICGTRFEESGKLYTKTYGQLSSISIDPVEKKPLYHFYPSRKILSIGSYGCTMQCKNCQNASISQCRKDNLPVGEITHLRAMINEVVRHDINLLAFTYNEPVVFYEYMLDVAREAHIAGVQTAMVSNGYINSTPLTELMKYISAFNIDLKAFNNDFYRKITGSELQPVLDTISQISNAGKHLEITFLVIPGLNDNEDEFMSMLDFIVNELDENTVLHISRYFPYYKLDAPPTPLETIKKLYTLAKQKLQYVYTGNTGDEIINSTYCPACGKLLIGRSYYSSELVGMNDNQCNYCGFKIHGIF